MTRLCNIVFVIGVLSQNINLSGFDFENQPLVLALVSVLTLFSRSTRQRKNINKELAIYFLVCFLALLINLFPMAHQDYVRLSLGPIIGWGLAREWVRIQPWALKSILVGHGVIFFAGLAFTEPTVLLLTNLGLRGVTYYDGWNAYFYSEPSYAALNIMFVYIALLMKIDAKLSEHREAATWGVFVIALLFGARSVTGFVFASLIFFKLINNTWRVILGGGALFLLSLAVSSPDMLPNRFNVLISAISESVKGGDILIFSELDPSSFYRIISNTVAAIGAIFHPFGFGTFLLNQAISVIDKSSLYLVSTALTSSIVFVDVDQQVANTAQSIPFAYLTFGGILFGIYFGRVFLKLVLSQSLGTSKSLAIAYMLALFFWQSQLGFVLFWLLSFLIVGNKKTGEYENGVSVGNINCHKRSHRDI